MTPNEEQIKSSVRWVLSTFGGMFAGWFAAKGWFTVDQVTQFINLPVVSSLLVTGVGLVWGLFTHTQTNAVAVVATLARDPVSPVKAVVVAPTEAGREMVQSVANSASLASTTGVVIAGTPAASVAAN